MEFGKRGDSMMYWTRREGLGALVAFTALMILLTLPTLAQGGSWITVVRKQGEVESRLAGSQTWLRVLTNRRLGAQDWARTLDNGVAHLRLADNSLVAVGPSTQVQMERFTLDSRSRDAALKVGNGSVRAQVSGFRGRQSRFEVTTPNAVLAAQGTDFLVTVVNPDEMASEDGWVQAQGGGRVLTRLAVFDGTVWLTNGAGRTLLVRPGGTAQVLGDGLPEADVPDFSFEEAGAFVRRHPGLNLPRHGEGPTFRFAPFDPGTRGTFFNHFGVGRTGLIADSKSTSTGQGDDDPTGGVPILITPRSESTGTLILDVQPPSTSYPSLP